MDRDETRDRFHVQRSMRTFNARTSLQVPTLCMSGLRSYFPEVEKLRECVNLRPGATYHAAPI
jgi:hypothetical protein